MKSFTAIPLIFATFAALITAEWHPCGTDGVLGGWGKCPGGIDCCNTPGGCYGIPQGSCKVSIVCLSGKEDC